MSKLLTPFLVFILWPAVTKTQHLKPGFDKAEYIEMLKISAAFGDSVYVAQFPRPQHSQFVYRSPVVGFDNRWDLWINHDSIAVLSIRGTTPNSVSWLANFYAAMVPATGSLVLNKSENFSYKLAENPRAAVHVGWLVSMASLSKDILPKIDSVYNSGIKDVIIIGHSQGGAISYLLTAYLHRLQQQQRLPADIRFKTYCSAASKPGNLYFAYDYELLTQNGWAYNVVNTVDWVPEVPISIQTLNDFNTTNPFVNAKRLLSRQKFPRDIVMKYVFNRLDKSTRRAQRKYEKYLGRIAGKMATKTLNGFDPPGYYNSSNYVRTGNTIVLSGDSSYNKIYKDNVNNIFIHHFHQPYLYLAERLDFSPGLTNTSQNSSLEGTWELTYLSGRKIALDGLYPHKKPVIRFDLHKAIFGGNTSCNSFSGRLNIIGSKINFTEPITLTKMFCDGEGETAFINTLKMVTEYSIADDQLIMQMGTTTVMKFRKL